MADNEYLDKPGTQWLMDKTKSELGKKANSDETYTMTQVDEKLADIFDRGYVVSGEVEFAELPSPSAETAGKVYTVTDAFTTTAAFIEGAGINYPAGTDVAIISEDDGAGGKAYKYAIAEDVMGSKDKIATPEEIADAIEGLHGL